MIKRHLQTPDADRGFILDGYPRTEVQAEALDEELKHLGKQLSATLLIDAPEEEIVRRLSGRRVCVKGQHNFHLDFDPPKHADRCDVDGSRLIVRDDDKPEVVQHRLAQYREKTAPLIDYYEQRGKLRRVDGSRSADEVNDQIRALVGALRFED
jgi:adenylate kinase